MADLATIRSILPLLGQMEDCVARARYQRPSVLQRSGQWCIRPFVPKLDPATGEFKRVQTWIPLGPVSQMKLAEAKREADRLLVTINDGRFVATAQLEFAGLVEKYLDAKIPLLGKRTQGKYRAHLKNHIVPAFGAKRLADIDTQAVEVWLGKKKAEGMADATRADLKNILSAVFSAAIKWRMWAGENPCEGVDLGRMEARREKRLLTMDEAQRFFASIPDTRVCTAETARLIAKTAIMTGLRVSELLGLQWQDLQGEDITVRRRAGRGEVASTKSKRPRVVKVGQLSTEIGQLKADGAKPEDWVFSREGDPLDDRDLQQHVYRPAAELAGLYVEGFGLHWLRAANITLRQQAGASAIEAAKAAGHSTVRMTAHYTLRDEAREKAQAAVMWERLEGQKGTVN